LYNQKVKIETFDFENQYQTLMCVYKLKQSI